MENYLSLEQAAAKIGVKYSAFRQRRSIKELAKSINFICQGSSHVRLYPVEAFPGDVRRLLPTPTTPAALSPLPGGDFSGKVPSWEAVQSKGRVGFPRSPLQTPNSKLLDPNSKESRQAKAGRDLLRIQGEWCQCAGITSESKCDRAFAAAVATGDLHIPVEIAAAIGWGKSSGISRGSLRRMRSSLEQSGCVRNLDRPKAKKIDERPDLADYIIAYIHNYAHANLTVLRRELIGRFTDVPSLSTLTRWVDDWKAANAATYLKVTNPDQWKNKYMSAFGSQSADVTQPNQRWELDSTPADILLVDGRYSVIAVVDVFTRRGNLFVSSRSKSEAIISLLRQTILLWGTPQEIKTDNGADYASNAMSNACGRLAIWQEFCPPYSPEKKPHVERFLGTFNHDWLPTLPGYAGHNVETRQAIRSQRSFADNRTRPDRSIEIRLTATEFQNACTNWVAEYNDRVHSSLGMQSPNSHWNAARFFPRYPAARDLDLLLAFQGERKVLKQGISFGGGVYIAPELLPGDKVQISIDAGDLGRIYVFDMLGNFVCEAIDPMLVGVDLQQVAEEAKRLQQAQYVEARKELKRVKSGSNFTKIQKGIVAGKVSNPEPTPPSGHPSQEGISRKVVSINKKPKLATPEELFERAWEIFASGAEVSLSATDFDRVWYSVVRGDSKVLLEMRSDYQGRKGFLDWLKGLAPAARKKA